MSVCRAWTFFINLLICFNLASYISLARAQSVPNGVHLHSWAVAINSNKDVVGTSEYYDKSLPITYYNRHGGSVPKRAFLYRNNTMIDIQEKFLNSSICGDPIAYSFALDINDNGDILGGCRGKGSSGIVSTSYFVVKHGIAIRLMNSIVLRKNNSLSTCFINELSSINNSGIVAGTCDEGFLIHPVTIDVSGQYNLYGGFDGFVNAINDNGLMVGSRKINLSQENEPSNIGPSGFLLSESRNEELSLHERNFLTGINNKDEIVGYTDGLAPNSLISMGELKEHGKYIFNGFGKGILLIGGIVKKLDLQYASSINSKGEIAGSNGSKAAIYKNNNLLNLGSLGGTNSQAVDINDEGDVVGISGIKEARLLYPTRHAFLYSNGLMKDLGTIQDYSSEDMKKLKGDVNSDGFISVDDAVIILRVVVGLETLKSEETIYLSDMDQDDKITVNDAVMVLRKIVGLN